MMWLIFKKRYDSLTRRKIRCHKTLVLNNMTDDNMTKSSSDYDSDTDFHDHSIQMQHGTRQAEQTLDKTNSIS